MVACGGHFEACGGSWAARGGSWVTRVWLVVGGWPVGGSWVARGWLVVAHELFMAILKQKAGEQTLYP